jgi:hypothetical protein
MPGSIVNTTHHKISTGLIMGIVVAAVVLIIGAFIALFLWRRHQKNVGTPITRIGRLDRPTIDVDPYYAGAATSRTSTTFIPGYAGPVMSDAAYTGTPIGSTSTPSTDPRYSYSSAIPLSSQALVEAQRGDRKVDPTAASAFHTRPLLPNTPSTSTLPTSFYETSSTPPVIHQMGGFNVANPEIFQVAPQDGVRRVASPPLPPGAALPRTISMHGTISPEAGQMERSNTLTAGFGRYQTPPPRYAPVRRDEYPGP